MPRSTDRTRFKHEAESTYPFRVDIEVPERGLGQRFNTMHEWCREHAGAWAQHGHMERRKGQAPKDFARFYFATRDTAAAFHAAFGGAVTEKKEAGAR